MNASTSILIRVLLSGLIIFTGSGCVDSDGADGDADHEAGDSPTGEAGSEGMTADALNVSPNREAEIGSLVARKGLTWVKYFHNSLVGQDKVGCQTTCDPYVGDTSCTQLRPILCIRKDGSGSNGFAPSFYDGWAAGNIGLTPPVAGTSLTSLAAADAQCVSTFGAGWRMAEHHDGDGGWAWRAYGNINDLYNTSLSSYNVNNRFWVHINDQPGNCWNP